MEHNVDWEGLSSFKQRNTTMKSNGLAATAATAVTDDDEARLQFIALNKTKRNETKQKRLER